MSLPHIMMMEKVSKISKFHFILTRLFAVEDFFEELG
jgi:hypothetical protein